MERLAVAAGLSRQTVYLAERSAELMSRRTAEAVAKVLGVDPEELRP